MALSSFRSGFRPPTSRIQVSWTKMHMGDERPWMHCPHCEPRVAKLYKGLGGYFRCVGNPIYASQALSAQAPPHFQACKLRLRLGGELLQPRHFLSDRARCIGAHMNG